DHRQSLQFAQRAASLAAQIGLSEELWETYTNIGKAYYSLNQLGQARQSFDQAISIVEGIRAQVAGDAQEQHRFFESKISPYHSIVELLIAQDNFGEALIYAERAKARALLDALSKGRISFTKSITKSEVDQERKLNSQIVSLNTQIYWEKQRQQPD